MSGDIAQHTGLIGSYNKARDLARANSLWLYMASDMDGTGFNDERTPRKVCFVITSKIHYARNKLMLEALRDHPDIDLQIVVGGSALIDKYGNVEPDLDKDGFAIDARFLMALEGGGTVAMAKSAGVGLLELPTIFENLSPDIVVVRGDRYEVLSVAVAAAYMNIPVAHIEGGDVSGTIDESVRHAVTKLAHIHFATSDKSARRILSMGEQPEYVFNVGSPELEFVVKNSFDISQDLINHLGVGDQINIDEPYLLVMQHPVTSEVHDARAQVTETLHAIHELGIPAIWFWPNIDAGTDETSKGMRIYRETIGSEHIRFLKYLPPDQFYGLLKKSNCLVGNSSSGTKEAALYGVPVVNVGTRQGGRFKGENVMNVPHDRVAIKTAIEAQIQNGYYQPDYSLYKDGTAERIVSILSEIPLYTQKQFFHSR